MTTEELGAIRKWALGPGPHNVYQLEKDVRALCDEVERLRAALSEALKWKEEDPRMLRDQIRVADVAFNHLHGEAEALKTQNKTLRDALLAVVAAEGSNREELGLLMRVVYRSNVDSDTKARSMQAIDALLATMP